MAEIAADYYGDDYLKEVKAHSSYLLFIFPQDRKAISKLTLDQKMEWYLTREPRTMVFLGNDQDFKRFWKWTVLVPMKLKRLYYRIKNGEIFKKYEHITEMKKKAKQYSI
jgi:hypothetical protein